MRTTPKFLSAGLMVTVCRTFLVDSLLFLCCSEVSVGGASHVCYVVNNSLFGVVDVVFQLFQLPKLEYQVTTVSGLVEGRNFIFL